MLKALLKKLRFYPELRRIYRSLVKYKKPFSYIYYRFMVKPRIKKATWLSHPVDEYGYSVHYLCSHSDLDMLLWAVASWLHAAHRYAKVYIHEDGSFTQKDRQLLARLLPSAVIVDYNWAKEQATSVWLKDYPSAKRFRFEDNKYIYAIKLVDPYFVSPAPTKLVLDTDVLWFSYPDYLFSVLKDKTKSFMMLGKKAPILPRLSYMNYVFKDGSDLPESIKNCNSGVVLYHQDNYKLDVLEEFCRKNGTDNPSRIIEQAGYAYVLDKGSCLVGPDTTKYLIKGKVAKDTATKHYTGPRREEYWFEGVKKLRSKILI